MIKILYLLTKKLKFRQKIRLVDGIKTKLKEGSNLLGNGKNGDIKDGEMSYN